MDLLSSQSVSSTYHLHPLSLAARREKITPICPSPHNKRKTQATANQPLRQQFITRTLTHARQNLTINGLDLPPPPPAASKKTTTSRSTRSHTANDPDPSAAADADDEEEEGGIEYEPYDARLATRLQALYQALENETMAVARLRREAPRKAAEGWRAGFLEEGGEGEEMEVDVDVDEEGVLGDVLMEGGVEERWQGVRGVYAGACEGLVGLRKGMTETVGRCERAGRVVEEVERG